MTVKKIFLSLILIAIIAITVVACGGTKNICPAYSDVQTETQAQPNS
jgi:hypothetical protein